MKSINDVYHRSSTNDRLTAKFITTLLGLLDGIYADLRFEEKEGVYISNFLLNSEHYAFHSEYGLFAYNKTAEFLEYISSVSLEDSKANDKILEALEVLQDDISNFCDPLFKAIYSYDDQVTYKIHYLGGLCKGLISDNVINKEEIYSLTCFFDDNKDVAYHPLLSVFDDALNLDLDNLSSADFERVKKAIYDFSGGDNDVSTGYSIGDTFFDKVSCVSLKDATVVFTGKFKFGTRSQCEKLAKALGGKAIRETTSYTDYVIVGALNSESWKYESFGRKVEEAKHFQHSGYPVVIISEDQWFEFMDDEDSAVLENFKK